MESPLLPPLLGGLTLLLLLGAAGCERKIEEPIALRPLDPSSVATDQAAPAGGRGRCIKPTPAVAKRSTPKGPDPKCPKDDLASPPKLRTGKVTFLPAEATGGKEIQIDIEITENEPDRQRGLMFRTQMPEMHGMLFVFDVREEHSFWMHNTCISLDMLYIDEDGLIVGIEESTPTMSDETFTVGCASKYVLEVNGGWTRSHGVKAGQWVKIER